MNRAPTRSRSRSRLLRSDRGAAAVEFALVALFALVPLIVGITEFGRAYHIQLSMTAGAREGVRVMAIENDPVAAAAAARAAVLAVDPGLLNVVVSPTDCAAGGDATLTMTYQLEFLTGWIGTGPELTGLGVMRCNG